MTDFENASSNTPQSLTEQTIKVLGMSEATKNGFAEKIRLLNERKEQWNNASWRIGLIGITSCGKSTLVNALLGENMLPMHVKPTSNCLIVSRYGKDRKAIVYYENDTASEIVSDFKSKIDEIGNELNTPANQTEIKEIHIFSPNFKLRHDISLVDSPGLEAYDKPSHDVITLNLLLPSLDFAIYLTTLKPSSDKENLAHVNSIAKSERPMIIVQNCTDTVKDKEGRDGVVQKDRKEVAKEHEIRCRRILQQSEYNVSSIPIVQISSKLALSDASYAQSNLDYLIEVIHHQVSELEPRFQIKRLKQLGSILKEVLAGENLKESTKETVMHSEQESLNQKRSDLHQIVTRIQGEFTDINNDFGRYKHIVVNKLPSINQDSVDEATKLEKELLKKIEEIKHAYVVKIDSMNKQFKALGKEMNLLENDFYYRPDTAPNIVKKHVESIKEVEESYLVEKKAIFGLGLRKAWGNFWGTDCGYERKTRTVSKVIIEAFRQNMNDYMNWEDNMLVQDLYKTKECLANYSIKINEAIISKITSIDESLKFTIPRLDRNALRIELEDISNNISRIVESQAHFPVIQENSVEGKLPSEVDLVEKELTFSDNSLNKLLKVMNTISNRRFELYFDDIIQDQIDKHRDLVFWYWDQSQFATFWDRFLPDNELSLNPICSVTNSRYNITAIDENRDPEAAKEWLKQAKLTNYVIVIMFDITQISNKEKKFYESAIQYGLSKVRSIVPCIISLENLWLSTDYIEYLKAFHEVLKNSRTKFTRVLVNHDDLTIAQFTERLLTHGDKMGTNITDETDFWRDFEEIALVTDPTMKKLMAEYLKEWRS